MFLLVYDIHRVMGKSPEHALSPEEYVVGALEVRIYHFIKLKETRLRSYKTEFILFYEDLFLKNVENNYQMPIKSNVSCDFNSKISRYIWTSSTSSSGSCRFSEAGSDIEQSEGGHGAQQQIGGASE